MKVLHDFDKILSEFQCRSVSTDEACDCPIWQSSTTAITRKLSEGGLLIYSARAGGIFQVDAPTVDVSDRIDCAFTVAIYNGFKIAPELSSETKLLSAPDSRKDRISALLFHIASMREGVDSGIDLGEVNPAHGHENGGYDEDPIHYQPSIYAAIGCTRDWEVHSVVNEAARLDLIRTEVPDFGDFVWATLTERGDQKVAHIRRGYRSMIRQSKDELLQRSSIDLIPDTNVLLEFEMLDQIEWKALFPNIENLHVLIVPKVSEEMDGHKSGKGRLRKRALWFNKLARQIEEEPDGIAVLKNADPRITVSLADPVRKQDLDDDQFELDDPDGRIVAETMVLMDALSDAFFISDDTKPMRIASKAGMLCFRPLDEWRRSDPPDERDAQIADLKAQLGALPALSVAIAHEFDRGGGFEFDEHIARTSHPEWSAAFAEELLRVHSPVDEETLRRRLANDMSFDPMLRNSSGGAQTRIDAYQNEYQEFEAETEKFAAEFLLRSEKTFFICPLRWELTNEGTATAEEFAFQVYAHGPLKFIPASFAEMFFGEAPAPPDPPESSFSTLMPHNFNIPIQQADPFSLDEFLEPEKDGSTTMLEWRCDQFRHGDSFSPFCFVVFEQDAGRSAAVEVKLRAKNIAKVDTQRFAVRGASAEVEIDRAFFTRRALFLNYEAYEPAQRAVERVFR